MGAARKGGRKKGRLTAQGISDFRIGVDRVERRDGKTLVVDGEGYYAPVEVEGDEMSPDFVANLAGLTDAQAAVMFEAVRLSPYLSPEGKSERMTALLLSGRVRLRFDVVAEKERKRLRAARTPEEQIFDAAMTLGEEGHAEAG